MKILREYKGVAIFFAVITLINAIWIMNYNPNENTAQVKNEQVLVSNA